MYLSLLLVHTLFQLGDPLLAGSQLFSSELELLSGLAKRFAQLSTVPLSTAELGLQLLNLVFKLRTNTNTDNKSDYGTQSSCESLSRILLLKP